MIASWLIDQLAAQGVRHICSAPGSRSTPLTLAAIEHPKIQTHVHFDERGLGFFALGLARALNEPVALITTSGTAVGNLLPSVMESYHTHTPLILLTADRPLELLNCSANQATDQLKIFHAFTEWQTSLSTDSDEKTIRSIAAQSYFHALHGPVHLNCPFREPLHLVQSSSFGKPIELKRSPPSIDSYATQKSKGVIVVGKLPNPHEILPILELAKRLQWPILADILSNARCHPTPEQIRYFDWNEKPNPELVLHFGERLTSKRLLNWLKTLSCEIIHVSPWKELQDPERLLTSRIQTDIPRFCQVFEAQTDPSWIQSWVDQEPIFKETSHFTEVHAMRTLSQTLPPEFAVYLGSGMPIRDADHFLFPKKCQGFFANRGLSGIDGNIATLAGLAEKYPILGFIGDQAALYDLNSLALLKKTKHKVILIISNNFGAGIFHHLPINTSPHFEPYWAAAHDLRFEKAAEMFALPYTDFHNFNYEKTTVVELITDRKQNHAYQQL